MTWQLIHLMVLTGLSALLLFGAGFALGYWAGRK